MNKKKLATSVAAVATAAALLLGGTFAWQSVNQTALNEASDVINPGGRLHDDFYIDADGNYNSDIYVENFADDEIFARVKLQEYMEIVINHGVAGAEIVETVVGSKTLSDAPAAEVPTDNTSGYEYEYVTHCFDQPNATEAYWDWTMGATDSAEVWYMPTFNMNKDSLEADLNGIYENGNVGTISNRDAGQYSDYTVWNDGDTKTANEIWDYDSNMDDELEGTDLSALIDPQQTDAENYVSDHITLVNATHEATTTGTTNGLISMSEWLDKYNDDEDTADYWVYDEDGWVYWSSPIAGGTATGLLLDSIELNQVMDDTWYYAINAVGQFVTADDAGKGDGTGFYADGEDPSGDAEILLTAIGVTLDGGDEDGGFVAQAGTLTGNGMSLYFDSDYIHVDETTNTITVSAAGGWQQGDVILDAENITFSQTTNTAYVWDSDSVDFSATDESIVDIMTYKDSNQVDILCNLGSDGKYKITATSDDGTYSGSIEFTIVAVLPSGSEDGGEDDEPEIIDQPLDIYVSYADGTTAGSQPTNPETGLPAEGVIQIFAIGIENKEMYLGGKLTAEDGTVLDSRDADSSLTVSYTFEDYSASMLYTFGYSNDSSPEDYSFTISTIEDENSSYNGYKVATCDQTGEQMAVMNETTGHLIMLAEDQPLNQSIWVKATTTYDGTEYESNSQQLFFVNRDIILALDGEPSEDHSGYYTPGTEATFTMNVMLLVENEQVTDSDAYPISWSVLDEDDQEITDGSVTVTANADNSYEATVVVSENADGGRYRVMVTYNHTADDGKNKGLYQCGWDIYSTNFGGDEEYEPSLSFWIDATPSGYIPEQSTNNITLTAYANYDGEYLDVTSATNWQLSGNTDSKTTLTDNANGTASLYIGADETKSITVYVDYEYEGETHTAETTIYNHPQVATMVVYDDETGDHLKATYTPGTRKTVNLTAYFFETYTGSVQSKEDAYTGDALAAIASHVDWYLIDADRNEIAVAGVTVTQDTDNPEKVAVTIADTVKGNLVIRCHLDSGFLIDFDIKEQ